MKLSGIALRLSLLILVASSIVLALVVGYSYRFARATMIERAAENAHNLALATVHRVETILRSTQKVPEISAITLGYSSYTKSQLFDWLRVTVEQNPEIYGSGVAFQPFVFDGDTEYMAPYFYKRGGTIEFTDRGTLPVPYIDMDWYQIPFETDRPSWSEPFFDPRLGNLVMSTYAVPIYTSAGGEKHITGMVTVDMSLDWLKNTISSVKILETGYAFLITRNGVIVTHPDSAIVMNETIFTIAEEHNRPELREIGRDMIKGGTNFLLTDCPDSTNRCWLYYAPLPSNGWSLGVWFPEDEMLADVHRLNRNVLAIGAFGLLLLLFLVVAVARSIARPLRELVDASEAVAQGNLDAELPGVTFHDEIWQLTQAFARMQRDLKRYIQDLQETANEREIAAAQLEEYSRTLEEKVNARTQDLSTKNQELGETLSQLQNTQKQLVVQEKLASLGALTAGVAHEIKNPLNFVNNFAQLSAGLTQELREELDAQRERLDPKALGFIEELLTDLEQNVTKINEHGKRADRIVRDMLQHSRGGKHERQPTDLNQLVGEYTNLAYHGLRGQDSSFNVKLETDFDPKIGTMNVIPQDLSRAFLNLVNNACYAAYAKSRTAGNGFMPTVRVSTKDLGDQVEIRVRDNGEGVTEEIREKIFNPFFSTKPTGSGTGLGLSITHDIVVQQHKGELRLESEPGKFAEFIIVLPKLA